MSMDTGTRSLIQIGIVAKQLIYHYKKIWGNRRTLLGFAQVEVMLGLPGCLEQTRHITKTWPPNVGNDRWLLTFDSHDGITSVILTPFPQVAVFGDITIMT